MASSDTSAVRLRRDEPLPPAVRVLVVTVLAVTVATADISVLGIGEMPLLYDYAEIPRLAITWLGVLAAALAASLAGRKRGGPVRFDAVLGLLVAVAGLAALSTIASRDPLFSLLGQSERLEGLVTWVGYAALYAVGLQVLTSARALKAVQYSVAAGALVNASYGIAQGAGLDPSSHVVLNPGFDPRRAFATFDNPNFLAGLLVLALPVTLLSALRARGRRAKAGWWSASALLCAALLSTSTRGAWIAFAVQVAGLVLLTRARSWRTTPRDRLAIVLFVAMTLAIVAVSAGQAGERDIIKRLTVPDAQGSISERVEVWRTAAHAMRSRPLLGYGPDSFMAAFRINRSEGFASHFGSEATVNNAHDWPLQAAVTLGIPAALALLIAFGMALWLGARALASSSGGDEDHVLAASLLACAGYLVHMMFNVSVHGASTPFWLLLAGLAAPIARTRVVPPRSWRSSGPALASLLLVAAICSAAVVAADWSFLRGRTEYRDRDYLSALDLGKRAARTNPTSVKYGREEARVRAELFHATANAGGGQSELRRLYEHADSAFASTLERHPGDYASLAWRAALSASAAHRLGDPALADAAARIAREAAAFDKHASDLELLSKGRTDPRAVEEALLVPSLP